MCPLLAVVPWLAAMMQTLTPDLDGLSHTLLSLLQILTPMTMSNLMQMSQHLPPWGNLTCLALACLGREWMSWLNQQITNQKQAALSPKRLSSAPLMSALNG